MRPKAKNCKASEDSLAFEVFFSSVVAGHD